MTKMYKMSYQIKGKQFNKTVSQPKALILTKLYGKQKGFRAEKAKTLPELKTKLGSLKKGLVFVKKKKLQLKEFQGRKIDKPLSVFPERIIDKPLPAPYEKITGMKGKPWNPETVHLKLSKEKYKELKKSMPKPEVAKAIRLEKVAIKLIEREFKARKWQYKFIKKVLEKTPDQSRLSKRAIEKKMTQLKSDMEMNREVRGQIGRKGSPALLSWLERLIPTISKRLPFLERYESKYKKRFEK